VLRVEEELRDLRRAIAVIAHRFGVLSEAGLCEAMRYVVEEVLGAARVQRWIHHDAEGLVYGYPARVEVDLVVRDGGHMLVEARSRASRGDVAELYRRGQLYERVARVRPRLVLVAGSVDPEAHEAAAGLGVEIKPAARE